MNVQLQDAPDLREALFNAGDIGRIEHIQVSTERVTTLRGIMFDIDPKLWASNGQTSEVPQDPRTFYDTVLAPMLARHPVLTKAEVRNSGTGLHVILQLDPALEFLTPGERERWAGIVEVVQTALPIDPEQPGITACTRPIASINSKNGALVELLKEGEPVTSDEVLQLYRELVERPFTTIFQILFGSEPTSPCPICNRPESTLSPQKTVGICYGGCGKVGLERLWDVVLKPRQEGKANG